MSKLTAKQELFCAYYAIKRNATQAAIAAGYSKDTAKQMGAENLSKPYLKKKIDELLRIHSEEAMSDGQKVIAEFEKIAFSESAYEFDALEMRMQDKLKALENLGRIHGIYEEDNRQGNKLVIHDVTEPKLRSEKQ